VALFVPDEAGPAAPGDGLLGGKEEVADKLDVGDEDNRVLGPFHDFNGVPFIFRELALGLGEAGKREGQEPNGTGEF